MGHRTALLFILLCQYLLFVGKVRCTRSVSLKKDNDKEIYLNLLNRPVNNTIQAKINPSRTIPIQTLANKDSIVGERQIQEAKEKEATNRPNTYLAITRTKVGSGKYSGVEGCIKSDRLNLVGKQFSTSRIRLHAGADSIEAGWRVDPSLYGSSLTYLFVRTDAGKTHCFDTSCPGYIHTNPRVPLGFPYNVSVPGGPLYDMRFLIIRDNKTRNWNLMMSEERFVLGYWPPEIFAAKTGFADRVEWGGAAYSPQGTPLPPMGSGNHPIEDPLWDGTISEMRTTNEKGQVVDASDLETYADNSKLYSVIDEGYYDKTWGHLMFYGGPGH